MKRLLLFLAFLTFPFMSQATTYTDTSTGGYTSASTTFTLVSGNLPDPAAYGSYYAQIYRSYYSNPTTDYYYESVLVTAKGGLDYVVTRGQQQTVARAKPSGYTWTITANVAALTPTPTVTATPTITPTPTRTPTPGPTATPTATVTPSVDVVALATTVAKIKAQMTPGFQP